MAHESATRLATPGAPGPPAKAVQPRRRWRPSLTSLILGALVLGVVAGVVVGEPMGALAVVGTVFVRLTLMTVIPYIVVSLIRGIGSLDPAMAKRVATRGVPVLLAFWAVILAAYYAMAVAFPTRTVASFYDPNRYPGATPQAGFDWTTFIPANPFAAMAEGLVPAIVVFSLAVGIAVVGVPHKEGLLSGLVLVERILSRITRAIVFYLSPIGVFSVVASAAGTMQVDLVKGLAVFLGAYVAGSLILVAVVLPLLASVITGISYRRLLGAFKTPALLGFTTANSLVAVPLLVEGVKDLLRSQDATEEEAESLAGTFVPLAFTLPLSSLGVLLFVLFLAWFDGTRLGPGQYVSLTVSGLLSLFGEAQLAIAMLIHQLGLPPEGVNVFTATQQLIRNLMTLVAVFAMGLFSATAGAVVVSGARVRPRQAAMATLASVLVVVVAAGGLSVALRPLGGEAGSGYETLQQMRITTAIQVKVYRTAAEAPPPPARPAGADLLTAIQQRGALRVGYAPDALPFSFFNAQGDLVGFDVERALVLAQMVESTSIEFIPVDRQDFAAQLDDGTVDIVMGAVDLTPSLYQVVDFSTVYMTLHVAVVAPTAQADDYRTEEGLARAAGRTIAVEKGSYYADVLRATNPTMHVVELASGLDFFRSPGAADVLFTSAEEGSAYTLMYPRYTVVVPEFAQPPLFLAYPVRKGEPAWLGLVNNWLTIEQLSGDQQAQYDYWITGKTAAVQQPRWSVIRDVFGWGR